MILKFQNVHLLKTITPCTHFWSTEEPHFVPFPCRIACGTINRKSIHFLLKRKVINQRRGFRSANSQPLRKSSFGTENPPPPNSHAAKMLLCFYNIKPPIKSTKTTNAIAEQHLTAESSAEKSVCILSHSFPKGHKKSPARSNKWSI